MLTTSKNSILYRYQPEPRNILYSLQPKKFKKGENIPQTSNNLWLLNKGVVKTLTWNASGKTIILGYWGTGDVIGLPLSKVNPYETRCLNAVEATSIPWEKCNYLLKEICHSVQQTDELLRIVRTEKMYTRLVEFLFWLGKKFGTQVSKGILIDLRLTHQEIADMIGSTRVTVTRFVNLLEQEKIIFRPCRFYIVIRNLDLLKKHLQSD